MNMLKRIGRIVVGLVSFIAIVQLLLWLALPLAARAIAPSIIQAELGRRTRIADIDFNPLTLTLTVKGLTVADAATVVRAQDDAKTDSDAGTVSAKDVVKGVANDPPGQGADAAPEKPLLTLRHLVVDLSVQSLRRQAPVIERLTLDGLTVNAGRNADGQLSVQDILDRLAAKPSSPEPARFALHNVQVRDVSLNWDDRVRDQQLQVRNLELALPFLSSMPADVAVQVNPSLSADVETGTLQLRASATPFGKDLKAGLRIEISQLPMELAQPWLPASAGVVLPSGELAARLDLTFVQTQADQRDLQVDGNIELNDVSVQAAALPQAAQPLKVARVSLQMKQLVLLSSHAQAPLSSTVSAPTSAPTSASPPPPASASPSAVLPAVAAVSQPNVLLSADLGDLGQISASGHLVVSPLRWDGQLQLSQAALPRLMAIAGVALPAAAPTVERGQASADAHFVCAQTSALSCQIARAQVRLTDLHLTEHSGAAQGGKPMRWHLPLAQAGVQDAHWPAQGPVRFDVQLDVQSATPSAQVVGNSSTPAPISRLLAQGELKLPAADGSGLNVDANVRINQLHLPMLQPYIAAVSTARVQRGQIDGAARVLFAPPAVTVAADAILSGLRVTGPDSDNALLAVEQLRVNQIDLTASTQAGLQRVRIDGASLAGVDANLQRNQAGSINWTRLMQQKPQLAAVKPQAGATPDAVSSAVSDQASAKRSEVIVDVGEMRIDRTNVAFSDDAVTPGFSAQLTGLKGRLTAFSTQGNRRSTVELSGSLDGDGLLVVSGQVDVLKPTDYLNISLRARGIEMTRLTPYAVKYAGYQIAKGKLSTTLNYRIENGKLTADNALFLDQLNFGDAIFSPDATTLPVRLAVALLKNLKGEIDLNLPVTGSLNDPQFSIGQVVFQALGNVILKAVTSPFRLLANLFDDEEEFVGSLDFEPGSAVVPPSSERQMRSLATLLAEKSDVELEITGYADPLTDTVGLQRLAQLQEKAAQATRASGAPEAAAPSSAASVGQERTQRSADAVTVDPERIRKLAYERAVAARKAIIALRPEVADRVFLVAPNREQLGRQAEKPRMSVDFSLRE